MPTARHGTHIDLEDSVKVEYDELLVEAGTDRKRVCYLLTISVEGPHGSLSEHIFYAKSREVVRKIGEATLAEMRRKELEVRSKDPEYWQDAVEDGKQLINEYAKAKGRFPAF